MILNRKKTKCLPFINSHTRDFIQQLSVEPGTNLEVIYQLRLVGLIINSEMTWDDHINYTVGRVNKTLWQLTRFKQLVVDRKKLITFYILKVRSILMFGAVCFHSALTQEQSKRLELQQKRSLAIILGSRYQNYKNALVLTSLPRLDDLRKEACLRWAIKAQNNPQHKDLFPLNQSVANTRFRKKFTEPKCRGSKFYNSAIPAMTRALNQFESYKGMPSFED